MRVMTSDTQCPNSFVQRLPMTDPMDKRVGVCGESGQRSEEPRDFVVTRVKEKTINSNYGTWADLLPETRLGPSYSNISEKGKGLLCEPDSLDLLQSHVRVMWNPQQLWRSHARIRKEISEACRRLKN